MLSDWDAGGNSLTRGGLAATRVSGWQPAWRPELCRRLMRVGRAYFARQRAIAATPAVLSLDPLKLAWPANFRAPLSPASGTTV